MSESASSQESSLGLIWKAGARVQTLYLLAGPISNKIVTLASSLPFFLPSQLGRRAVKEAGRPFLCGVLIPHDAFIPAVSGGAGSWEGCETD